jgi:hypothetical protein
MEWGKWGKNLISSSYKFLISCFDLLEFDHSLLNLSIKKKIYSKEKKKNFKGTLIER